MDEAIGALTSAVDMWDAVADLDQLATTTVELGMTYTWLANVGPAVPITRRVLERIAQAPAARQYPLLLINTVFTAVVGDVGKSIATWDQAKVVRREAASPALDQIALATEPHLRWVTMDLECALVVAREAERQFDNAGLVWSAADIARISVYSDYFLGRFPAPEHVEALQTKARRVGQNNPAGVLGLLRAYLTMHQGDFDRAEVLSRESAEFSRSVNNRLPQRDRRGDRERARELLTEAESLASAIGMVLIERRARNLRLGL